MVKLFPIFCWLNTQFWCSKSIAVKTNSASARLGGRPVSAARFAACPIYPNDLTKDRKLLGKFDLFIKIPAVFCCWNLHVHYTSTALVVKSPSGDRDAFADRLQIFLSPAIAHGTALSTTGLIVEPTCATAYTVLHHLMVTVDGRINKWHMIDR